MDNDSAAPQPLMPPTGEPIDFWLGKPLEALEDDWGKLRCRFINSDPKGPTGSWSDFVMSEWELKACGWEDRHPHTETAFVLEGELHIESEGKTVILKAGDSARVNPNILGRYSAPVYARMLTIYGPNPAAEESDSFRYYEI